MLHHRAPEVRSILACIAAAAVGIGVAGTARAQAEVTRQTLEFIFFDACTDETLSCTSTVQEVRVDEIDQADGVHTHLNNHWPGFHCVGDSGTEYNGTVHTHIALNFIFSGTVNDTVPVQFALISLGPEPNLMRRGLLHITIDSNGETAVFLDVFEEECIGPE
jgi:hypothetical protein